jgi:hypothetical protein
VIAVNPSLRTVTAAVNVPGLRGEEAFVFGERRSVPVRDGTIVDRFPPLAARVYAVPPSQ